MTIGKIVEMDNFVFEYHKVETDDNYILELHRVIAPDFDFQA